MKKCINIFLIIVAAVFSINLQAMEESKKRPADSMLEAIESESKKLKTDGQELRPIVIIINHLGEDNGANLNDLKESLSVKPTSGTMQPIIMVSPSIVSKLLEVLETKFKDRPSHLYEGKKCHIKYVGNPRCINYFEKVLEDFFFVDNPKSHFITIFPRSYQENLSLMGCKTCTIRTTEELMQLVESKKDIKSPCKQDFEAFAKICNSMENTRFKALIHGHGFVGEDDKETCICNLCPKDCSDMLSSFDKTNITSIVLSTCCVGGKNKRFLQNKEACGRWIPAHYSFNLIIRGITDQAVWIRDYTNVFLQSTLNYCMSPQEILYAATDPENKTYEGEILQIMPAGSEKFITYENDYIAIIDEQTDTNKPYVLEKANNLVYPEITETPLIMDTKEYNYPKIFFMTPEKQCYTLKNITLEGKGNQENAGVINFIKEAFRCSCLEYLPKNILIETLQGKNDIPTRLEGKKPNKIDAVLAEITLHNVKIHIAKNVAFNFVYNDRIYQYEFSGGIFGGKCVSADTELFNLIFHDVFFTRPTPK